jgi:aerobic-type carbon monoxide dehydrogenase small subunit (CoxS/CutS family)
VQFVGEADLVTAEFLSTPLDKLPVLKAALTRLMWIQVSLCFPGALCMYQTLLGSAYTNVTVLVARLLEQALPV